FHLKATQKLDLGEPGGVSPRMHFLAASGTLEESGGLRRPAHLSSIYRATLILHHLFAVFRFLLLGNRRQ
ncbi:MAG: hypothetical protein JWN70_114, partial [Planctomycetaceae bacterium]|nr:hypothetical protein [Planctomycetaceae bacterium]